MSKNNAYRFLHRDRSKKKLYKAKKNWLVASMVLGTFVGVGTFATQSVNADTTPTNTPQSSAGTSNSTNQDANSEPSATTNVSATSDSNQATQSMASSNNVTNTSVYNSSNDNNLSNTPQTTSDTSTNSGVNSDTTSTSSLVSSSANSDAVTSAPKNDAVSMTSSTNNSVGDTNSKNNLTNTSPVANPESAPSVANNDSANVHLNSSANESLNVASSQNNSLNSVQSTVSATNTSLVSASQTSNQSSAIPSLSNNLTSVHVSNSLQSVSAISNSGSNASLHSTDIITPSSNASLQSTGSSNASLTGAGGDGNDSSNNSSTSASASAERIKSLVSSIFGDSSSDALHASLSSIYDDRIDSANADMNRILGQSDDQLSGLSNRDADPDFGSATFAQQFNNNALTNAMKPSSYIQVGSQKLSYQIGTPHINSLSSGGNQNMPDLTPGFSVNDLYWVYSGGDFQFSNPLLFQLNNSTDFQDAAATGKQGQPSALRIWSTSQTNSPGTANGTLQTKFSVDSVMNGTTYTFDGILTMFPVSAGRVEQQIQIRNVTGLDTGHPVDAPGLTIGQHFDAAFGNDDWAPIYLTGNNQGLYSNGSQSYDQGYQLHWDLNGKNGPTGWAATSQQWNSGGFPASGLVNGSSLGQKSPDDATATPAGTVAYDQSMQGDSGLFMIWKGQDLKAGDSRTIAWVGRIKSPDSPDYKLQNEYKTVNKTYNFVDSNNNQSVASPVTQTVKFERTGIYNADTNQLIGYNDNDTNQMLDTSKADSAWFATTPTTVGNISIPDLSSKGYINPSAPTTTNVSVSDSDSSTNLIYNHNTSIITPDTNATAGQSIPGVTATYPSGVSHDDLYHKAVRTINYKDDQNNTVAPTVTQAVTLTRNAVIDDTNGQIIGYAKPNDSTVQSDPNTAWTPIDANNGQWSAVNSPDLTNLGYTAPDNGAVPVATINSTASDSNVTVTYHHQLAVLSNNNTQTSGTQINSQGTAVWPSGIDSNSLQHTVHRQVNVVDQRNNNLVSPLTQTAQFNRYAVVDKVTGQLLGYSSDNSTNNIIPVAQGDNAWAPQSKQFDAVTLPDLTSSGYVNPDSLSVPTVNVPATTTTDYAPITFVYKDGLKAVSANAPQTPGQKINAVGDIVWPTGVATSDLNKSVTRTITGIDGNTQQAIPNSTQQQSVAFHRQVIVDAVTGQIVGYSLHDNGNVETTDPNAAWLSQSGNHSDQFSAINPTDLTSLGYQSVPTVNPQNVVGTDNNSTVTVAYPHVTSTFNPLKFDATGLPDTTKNAVTKLVTSGQFVKYINRTINLVDSQTGQSLDGGKSYQNVFYQLPIVDHVTGQVVGYTLSNGQTSTNTDQAWQSDNNVQPAFDAPDYSSKGYLGPSNAHIPERDLVHTDSDQTIQIAYPHASIEIKPSDNIKVGTPVKGFTYINYPQGVDPNSLLKTITRTIHYNMGPNQSAVWPFTQSVTFSRNAIIDAVNGHLIGYDTNGQQLANVTVANGDNAWLPNTKTFNMVPSPDLSWMGLINPSQTKVDSQTIDSHQANINVNVDYQHNRLIIPPDNPQDIGRLIQSTGVAVYPKGVDVYDLHRRMNRTTEFLDATNGKSLAEPVVQTAHFTRSAVIDQATGDLIGYTNDNGNTIYQPDDPNSWISNDSSLTSVNPIDLDKSGYYVQNIDSGTHQIKSSDSNITKSITYGHKLTYVNPTDQLSVNGAINQHATWPTAVSSDQMNKQIVRTIDFVDADSKAPLQPSIKQVVNYYRAPVIDQVTGQVVGYSVNNDHKIDFTPEQANDAWYTNDTWPAMTVPSFMAQGYQSVNDQVATQNVKASDNSTNVVIAYPHQTELVTHTNGHNSTDKLFVTNWPMGVTTNDLNKTITRTINYVDANTNKVLKAPTTQTVNFYRNALVDKVTGKLVGYVNPQTQQLSNQAFVSDNDTFAGQDTIDIPGYETQRLSADQITADDTNQVVNLAFTPVPVFTPYSYAYTPSSEASETSSSASIASSSVSIPMGSTEYHLIVNSASSQAPMSNPTSLTNPMSSTSSVYSSQSTESSDSAQPITTEYQSSAQPTQMSYVPMHQHTPVAQSNVLMSQTASNSHAVSMATKLWKSQSSQSMSMHSESTHQASIHKATQTELPQTGETNDYAQLYALIALMMAALLSQMPHLKVRKKH